MSDEQPNVDSSEEEGIALFDKLYASWHHVYGMDKARAKIKEELPDISFPPMWYENEFYQASRSLAKYEAATVRYRDIAYPNAEAVIDQLRAEFEHSEAKQDATRFPIVSSVLEDIYMDTVMDVVYSGYLTMSNAIENSIRQVKIILNIPENKNNSNDPVFNQFGINFQRLMNKERTMKYWSEVTSSRIFSINAIANRIKHEFAIVRQDDVLIHYLPNLVPGEHIRIDKMRFFFDLNYTRSYLFLLVQIGERIRFSENLKTLSQAHGTQNNIIVPSPEQNVLDSYNMLLDLDNILGAEHTLPTLTSLPHYIV